MSELDDIPRVAAPHLYGGPSCYFCDWSNPTLELEGLDPDTETD